MIHALSWFAVIVLLVPWSLAAWALHSVAVWAGANAGAPAGAASGHSAMALPDGLAPWVPPEVAQWATQLPAALGPVVDSLLQAAPALAGGVTAEAPGPAAALRRSPADAPPRVALARHS